MRAALLFLLTAGILAEPALAVEQMNKVSYLRGPYNGAFFHRHNDSFRISAALHFYHGIQHDVLVLSPLENHAEVDRRYNRVFVDFLTERKAGTEPTMDLYAPVTARKAWKIFRAIDWTHMHHEQTYDILSDRDIAWNEKKPWTDRAVAWYLEKNPVARSPAPLEVTMRRAAVMMKPYFTYYRNYYPRSATFAYVAHWWHPVIYDAQLIAGNDGQEETLAAVNRLMREKVLIDRPQRMHLSREIMPRYSRLSPESANIFDNLHMLHGIIYDILAYEGWSDEEKQAELYRVVDAMSYQPGDEAYARQFPIPHPAPDPRTYPESMRTADGEMSRIMRQMMQEMLPGMMVQPMTGETEERFWEQFRYKMTPGMQEGEHPGSLHEALMKVAPGMKMSEAGMAPGKVDQMMVDMMLDGWKQKAPPEVAPWPMDIEPSLGKEVSR